MHQFVWSCLNDNPLLLGNMETEKEMANKSFDMAMQAANDGLKLLDNNRLKTNYAFATFKMNVLEDPVAAYTHLKDYLESLNEYVCRNPRYRSNSSMRFSLHPPLP